MANIIEEIRAAIAAKRGLDKISSAPKLAFLDPAHLTLLLTVAGSLYGATHNMLPPQESLYIGVGLTVLFLLYSFILKLHGQTAQTIPGIPTVVDPVVVQKIVSDLYPNILKMEQGLKAALEGKLKLPTAVPVPTAAAPAVVPAPPVAAQDAGQPTATVANQ